MKLDSQAILGMNFVGDLFENDKNKIKLKYFELSKIWHPDLNGNSEESNKVMSKINQLYEKALVLMEENKWEKENFIRIACENKKAIEVNYRKAFEFELGKTIICDSVVIYLIEEKFKDFYNNGIKNIKNFKFASDSMKKEMQKYLPEIISEFKTIDKQYGVVFKKTEDLLSLEDVLNYYKQIPDRHVAWILSSLYNIACYFDYIRIAHNGITLNNYFISPKYHSGALLGGWWYSVEQSKKMIGVPKEIFNILPPKTKEFKISNITTDLEAIRFIGKKLIGEKNNIKLRDNNEVPKPFINWLLSGSSEKAVEEYTKWNKILDESYGKRTFVKMELSVDNLYK